MNVDYPVLATVAVGDPAELRAALAEHPAVRLVGTGSAQVRLPAPDQPVTLVSTAGMDRILRLEADDLTCSVEPGVRRDRLDAELAERGLCLPCAGSGTVAGSFAADEFGPLGPAQPEPRGLLLGMTGLLAEGKRFRAGARVVKNVAGFDLPKLFVGSRGRLFAVTELHLKLRPRPPAVVHFANRGLEPAAALALLRRLRRHPTRPAALVFEQAATAAVLGTLAGRPAHLQRLVSEFGLQPVDGPPPRPEDFVSAALADGDERIQGQVRGARLAELLAGLPEGARFRFGGERFVVTVPAAAADAVLERLAALQGVGEVTGGAAARRGRTSPGDPVAARLAADLKRALDPRGVLR